MNPIDKFFVIFQSIVIEALPFIILGAVISGILEVMLPQKLIARVIPRRRWVAIACCACLGLVFPMCECGIVPVMRRLLSKGLPLSCAVAYMLAAPIINPVVITSTWAAFSGDRSIASGRDGITSAKMVTIRVGLAFITSCAVAAIVDRSERRHGLKALVRPILGGRRHVHDHQEHEHKHASAAQCSHDHEHDHHHDDCGHEHPPGETCGHEHPHHHHHHHAHDGGQAKREAVLHPTGTVHRVEDEPDAKAATPLQRLTRISEIALHDFVDIAAFLILGAILAAVVQTLGVVQLLPGVSDNPLFAVPAMMILAVLLCLCSEADAFVAANMIAIPLAGKTAFLVLGPMLDIKLYLMYTRVFRSKLIWTIIPSVVVIVWILSLAVHYLDAALTTTGP